MKTLTKKIPQVHPFVLTFFICQLLLLNFPISAHAASPTEVLVVDNINNANSHYIALQYIQARNIPTQNLLELNLPSKYSADTVDTMSLADYYNYVVLPVHAKIQTLSKTEKVNYIVMAWFPFKLSGVKGSNPGYSLPNNLAISAYDTSNAYTPKTLSNPFAWGTPPFSSAKYGMYLVTNLDGWTPLDASNLIKNSLAATPNGLSKGVPNGQFFFQGNSNFENSYRPSYSDIDSAMQGASTKLANNGFPTSFVNKFVLPTPNLPLGGYFSFGSNSSGQYNANVFDSLTFQPGAIAETIVSTSGAYLRNSPPAGAQSQNAELIHNGVTGVKGYVSEPSTGAMADPSILFLSYTQGANMAEAFYSASMCINWQDVYVGDPLSDPLGQIQYRRSSRPIP